MKNEIKEHDQQLSVDTEMFNAILCDPQIIIIKRLESWLKNGGDINSVNDYNEQLFDPEITIIRRIKRCLIDGANINAHNKNYNGNTMIHIAAEKCYYKIVKFLLENKANQDIVNDDNETAKDIAVRCINAANQQ